MSERAIFTEGLSKSFGAQAAVTELNLQIQPGAVYGFLGRNGAGKTTTMRMLLGLVRPTKGRARVLGLDPTKEAELLRILERVAFVPQRKQLYGWATPAELVRMNKAYFPRWSDDAAARLAERLEIPTKMAFKKLSIGNQTKVALLLALAQEAEVLILDEPTAGLDPQSRLAVWEMVRDMRRRGTTILLTTHNMEEADQLCDRVAIIDHGKILVCDTPSNLKQRTGAQRVLELHVDGARQSLAEGLGRIPAVTSVEITQSGVRVLAGGGDGLLSKVFEIAQGYQLRDISMTEPSLETVFILLTGRNLRD